jgi:serine/threonine protein kinase
MPELVRTVGRYGILRELGRGGMAFVYLARQADLDRLVALKELGAFHASDPALARRFVRESRLAGSLVHPNVITVFDYFEHEGTPYIAMEYVERGSLRPYVGRLSTAQIGGVLEGVLSGLVAAEARAIVHRDLKPENVLVTADGGVKIADFGIAKAMLATDTGGLATATGTAVGTPRYMAPEQAMSEEIGPWTDLYSLGCMAYELFTGKPPFHDADVPMAILMRHVTEPLTPASEVAGVDAQISAWIERLTAKDPKARPPSAAAAAEDLDEILIGLLGPRWRRESRLPEPPRQPAAGAGSSAFESFRWDQGPATPPPPAPLQTPEGIDLQGTGPDTSAGSPAATVPAAPTPEPAAPPPAARAQPSAPEPTGAVSAPTEPARPPAAPPRHALLARAGAGALLAGVLIFVLASGIDRWNLFAVLSVFEAIGVAVAVWIAAGRASVAATGALAGFGALTTVTALGLIKFTAERLETVTVVLTVVVVVGAVAILVAGVGRARAVPREAAAPIDPATLVLGLAGTGLACAALFVNYDGFSSLWLEVQEGESAEFFFEPALAVAAMLVGLVALGARPRLAAGFLVAVGMTSALHYLGLIVAAWRGAGEVGDVRAAGFLGLLGALLVLAAGAYAASGSSRPTYG